MVRSSEMEHSNNYFVELDNKELPLDVVVFGAFGGRFDHEMSAIHELYRSRYWFKSMTLLSHSNLACLVRPGITTIVSLLPFHYHTTDF